MASEGPKNPGTASGWTNSGNAAASDNAYATVAITLASTTSITLSLTNFGFAIPAGATIDGVVVEVERKVSSTARNPKDNNVQLIKGGASQGNNNASGAVWPTADAYATYGGAADVWGLALTVADVNASNFGVLVSVKRDAGAKGTTTYSVDHVRITVYYTEAAGGAARQTLSLLGVG